MFHSVYLKSFKEETFFYWNVFPGVVENCLVINLNQSVFAHKEILSKQGVICKSTVSLTKHEFSITPRKINEENPFCEFYFTVTLILRMLCQCWRRLQSLSKHLRIKKSTFASFALLSVLFCKRRNSICKLYSLFAIFDSVLTVA